MAIVKRDEVVFGGNCQVPSGVYTVRIEKADRQLAKKSGNPKAVLQCVILAPEEVVVGDQTFGIAGRKFTIHQPLNREQGWGMGKLLTALDKSNYDYTQMTETGDFDDDRLAKLAGHTMEMMLDSTPNVKRYALTEEDRQAGLTEGRPMLDGEGKEIHLGWNIEANLDNVIGPGQVVAQF